MEDIHVCKEKSESVYTKKMDKTFHNKMQNKGVQHRHCREGRLPPNIKGGGEIWDGGTCTCMNSNSLTLLYIDNSRDSQSCFELPFLLTSFLRKLRIITCHPLHIL